MEISKEEYAAFLGSKADYYLDKWESIAQGSKNNLNGYAFLFGLFWFLYRKMYLLSLIILAILTLESIVETAILEYFNAGPDTYKIMNMVAYIVCSFIFGSYGNWLYLKDTQRQIRRLKKAPVNQETYWTKLKKAGGTSWLPLIALLIVFVMLILLNN
jgi:hypothetical protein